MSYVNWMSMHHPHVTILILALQLKEKRKKEGEQTSIRTLFSPLQTCHLMAHCMVEHSKKQSPSSWFKSIICKMGQIALLVMRPKWPMYLFHLAFTMFIKTSPSISTSEARSMIWFSAGYFLNFFLKQDYLENY